MSNSIETFWQVISNFKELSPWNPPGGQLGENFPIFYTTQWFITVFTLAIHWFIPSTSRFFPVVSFLLDFPPKSYMHSAFLMRGIFHVHLIFLDLTILILFYEQYNVWSPHYTVFSNLIPSRPSSVQVLSSAPCSQIISVYFLPSSQRPNFTSYRQNYIFCCILIFTFLNSRREDKKFWADWNRTLPECDLNFVINQILMLLALPIILTSPHFKCSIGCFYVMMLPCILMARY
jgi:hypothetical protein